MIGVQTTPQALIADLARVFPRQKIERGTLTVYLRELEDIPVHVLEMAVHDLIRTSEWFPTVAAIRKAAAEHVLALPVEAEALAQIERRMQWSHVGVGPPPSVHPLVREAVARVGGYYSFRSAEDAAVLRGQFGRLYRDMRAAAITEAQHGRLELTPTSEGAAHDRNAITAEARSNPAVGDQTES